jgi:transposase
MLIVWCATIHPEEASLTAQQISVLGNDITKLVFHVVGMDHTEHVGRRKYLSRRESPRYIASLPPLLVGMETCETAYYWARCFREHGRDVPLIAAQSVNAYVKSPKHEPRDAEAICDAFARPTMSVAPIRPVKPQNLQVLHPVRVRLIRGRKALVHEVFGIIRRYGIILLQGIPNCRQLIVLQLEAD